MSRLPLLTAMSLLFFVVRGVSAATIFTTDVTFLDGDDYWSVEIHQNAHAEVLGGIFGNRLQLFDNSTARLAGGDIMGGFAMQDSSRASVHAGTYINTYIFMLGSAELDIFGGGMPDRFLDATSWGGNPLITFHGHNLKLDPTGGSEGDGIVTGYFADGSAFAVNLRGDATASRIRLADVPEPCSAIIWSMIGLTIGCARFVRRSRNLATSTALHRP